ncbi:hypothetical protein ACFQI7_16840 [Paenibacillus allorhizosphaerae]|uniref:Uncharacterized protein n=1 Tax=Paenibacillus allorhizosphaerae TaxID=2849866 RepID=A0ABM8VE90_9BACL|nr:hypothetical protein [Paenibacillus allorhizosphaerae]CAG7630542.1 hypothetical protein PAECIP111802_01647 [Paenibacillus allorhizosphaerae]
MSNDDMAPVENDEPADRAEDAAQAGPQQAAREADGEWRQFIRSEAEKWRRRKDDQEATLNAAASGPKPMLASVVEQLPINRMIQSTVRFIKKELDLQSAKNRKKRRKGS